jgi:hypothetical protein
LERNKKETIRAKIELPPDDPQHEQFLFVKNTRGFSINAELLRVLIKEEYDRLHKVPFPIDDALSKEIEKFMSGHPELGFRNLEDFLRSAARRQLAYGQK